MTTLRSIQLQNFRRFGKDVTIPFGPGATVLLAPNGTGKTTVFEAIEFALVGNVRRTGESLLPLVREGTNQASVRLAFDHGEVVARISSDAVVDRHGDLSPILGQNRAEDAGYLLRLTHLLDQRDKNWFIHQEDERLAGDLLARLPLGREAANVYAALSGASKGMTLLVNDLERMSMEATAALARWNSLLEDRESAKLSFAGPLVPLQVLAAKLAALSPTPKESYSTDIASLKDRLATFYSRLTSASEVRARRIATLQVLSATPQRFEELTTQLDQLRTKEKNSLESVTLLRQEQERILEDDAQLQVSRANIELESTRASEVLRRSDAATELRRQHSLASEAVALARREFEDLSSSARLQAQKLGEIQKQHDALEQVRAKRGALQQEYATLARAEEALESWAQAEADLSALQAEAATGSEVLARASAEEHEAVEELERKREVDGQAQVALRLAANSVDAIKSAVAVIAQHLDASVTVCPTCGVDHGADALRRRVEASLHASSPRVAAAAAKASETSDEVQAAASRVQEMRSAIAAQSRANDSIQGRITTIQLRIRDYGSHFKTATTVSDARRELDALRSDLGARAQAIQKTESECTPVAAEELAAARSQVNSLEARLTMAQAKLDTAEGTHAVMALRLLELTGDEQMSESARRELQSRIDRHKHSLLLIDQQKADIESRLRVLEARIGSAEAEASRHAFEVRGPESELQRIQSEWISAGLDGHPLQETLNAALQAERAGASFVEKQLAGLVEVRAELARWDVADKYKRVSEEIDQCRGSLTESEMSSRVVQAAKSASQGLEAGKKRRAVLNDLAVSLDKQIQSVSDRMRLVLPQWQRLLRRVVRDQRYSDVSLDVSTYYKKYHASVKVALDARNHPISHLASEAQMADVQLTFQLAMATVHPWSPWKALLLDDPTQHHDLVHASAVFDVLRDYVVEQGFQMLLATHDETHAGFLVRKLRNDGVDARICRLQPTRNGVECVAQP